MSTGRSSSTSRCVLEDADVDSPFLQALNAANASGASVTIAGGAWTPFEHLLIAAFVFPLIVKKMLAEEGSYALTEEDEVKCVSIDRLFLAASWNGNDENTSWRRILEAERERRSRARLDAKLAELFAADGESAAISPEDSSQPLDEKA